ncbi:ABC transporter ATP-binding protein [Bacillota bacterium Meth-B3]
MSSVALNQVTKTFGKTTVLHELSGSFPSQQIHGIIGRNGSGKTVLFKLITGLMPSTSGEILVEGRRIMPSHPHVPDGIGAIIETPGFLPYFSGYRNLSLLASIRHQLTPAQIKETMLLVGLDPHNRKWVSKYSMGMRQRLGIAQAIMEDPDLLILDEPMNGLDNAGVQDMRKLFLELKARGKTILLASHNREDIEALCDTVCEMDAGKLTRVR